MWNEWKKLTSIFLSNPSKESEQEKKVCRWWRKNCRDVREITFECRDNSCLDLNVWPFVDLINKYRESITDLYLDCHFLRHVDQIVWDNLVNMLANNDLLIRIHFRLSRTSLEHQEHFTSLNNTQLFVKFLAIK